ncbi:hypothetical protein [Chondromyces crocatus]|uniref:Uncharacterized protein n=1 Tax=Chondromyces crocatus TaxID=52 RepID=A0A0K1EQU6_CHOCO|nr:hypothetical protein [Chondromyces crocatus]AKT43300.1 uncharacterized protein CMC5_075320 [Chondromyces crocatus]
MTTLLTKTYEGPLVFDFQSLGGLLRELPRRGTRGLRRQKPGWEAVALELSTRLPVHADTLRIASDLGLQIATLSARLDAVRTFKRTADKLAEVAAETEAFMEDQREGLIALVVEAVRKGAKRTDPALMTAFEKTVGYHGQHGAKAAQTRRQKEEAAAVQAAEAAEKAADLSAVETTAVVIAGGVECEVCSQA